MQRERGSRPKAFECQRTGHMADQCAITKAVGDSGNLGIRDAQNDGISLPDVDVPTQRARDVEPSRLEGDGERCAEPPSTDDR